MRALLLAASLSLAARPARAELGDEFGGWLASDGARVVVGAMGRDEAGVNAGAAEVFVLSNGTWRFEQRLIPADVAPFSRCGASVAVAGDLVAFGCYPEWQRGLPSAYVFLRGPEGWTEAAHLTMGPDALEHEFGLVGAEDGWVAVGTDFVERATGPDPGEIHLFRREGDSLLERQVLSGEPGPRRTFARSYRLAGGTLLVHLAGGFELYARDGDEVWRQVGSLGPPEGFDFERAAYAYDGESLLVYDLWSDGDLLLYRREGHAWSAPQTIVLPSEPSLVNLAVAGDTAAATLWDGEAEVATIETFARSGGAWASAGAIEGPREHSFGLEVALTGPWLWAGQPGGWELTAGEAKVYRRSGGEWALEATIRSGVAEPEAAGCAIGPGPGWPLLVLLLARRRRR